MQPAHGGAEEPKVVVIVFPLRAIPTHSSKSDLYLTASGKNPACIMHGESFRPFPFLENRHVYRSFVYFHFIHQHFNHFLPFRPFTSSYPPHTSAYEQTIAWERNVSTCVPHIITNKFQIQITARTSEETKNPSQDFYERKGALSLLILIFIFVQI